MDELRKEVDRSLCFFWRGTAIVTGVGAALGLFFAAPNGNIALLLAVHLFARREFDYLRSRQQGEGR